MADLDDLARALRRIDQKSYGAYKSIRGAWQGDGLTLFVDQVQGDPFATPSRLRLRLPHGWLGIPEARRAGRVRRIALADFLLDVFAEEADALGAPGSGGSGRVRVDAGGAEVLERSGCQVLDDAVELRFRVGLPAQGRRVLGRAASTLLAEDLPRAAEALRWAALDQRALVEQERVVEDHDHLQRALAPAGLIAFVRDGSVLPRRSGIASEPLADAVPFESPPSLRVTLSTRHHGEVRGMGVREGVTLLVGGGFHGKTTLLDAIAAGVYPHVPGDGREWVVTRADAVTVRSEDGRSVVGVDLSPFIRALPRGRDTARFETTDASGSTSLAAGILEAVELGASALLLDEDTCATNLLVRDGRMQALIEAEPIVPLIDRVRDLAARGVSTVLALGGSGDYLEVADHVVGMEAYVPRDLGPRAAEVVREVPSRRRAEEGLPPIRIAARRPRASSFDGRVGTRTKVRARGLRELSFGDHTVDLVAVAQLVDDSQVRAIGALLERAERLADGRLTIPALLERLMEELDRGGLVGLRDIPELARPRRFEVGAALNRLRSLALA